MNTIQIQPIDIWSPSGQREVVAISLTNFYGYEFINLTSVGYVDYTLLGINNEYYYNGTIEIPNNIVQQWGSSDDIIYNYVLQTLGLIKI